MPSRHIWAFGVMLPRDINARRSSRESCRFNSGIIRSGNSRVSTKQQGASGLGLEAQRKAVADYAQRSGGKIETGYTEVESGKRADRP
jgi:hypothetical protein